MACDRFLVIIFLVSVAILFLVNTGVAAPAGTGFSYQGRLIDENRPASGIYDMQFRLYDAGIGGSQIGGVIDVNEIEVAEGYFTAVLDFGSQFDGNARWLEIGVRAGELNDPSPYTILSPRQIISPAPYALYAASCPWSGISVPLELSGSTTDSAIISGKNLNFGKGVYGESANGFGIYGQNNVNGNHGHLGSLNYGAYGYSTNGSGVYGQSASQYGVRGYSTNGIGIFGQSSNQYGVYGYSDSSNGVYGRSANYHGVYGVHDNSGNYGYLGDVGYGAYGIHQNSGNYGCLGSLNYGAFGYSASGSGVFGQSFSSYGVYGYSTTGNGMYGQSSSNNGVYGYSTSSSGVYGRSNGNYGVYGLHDNSGNYGYLGSSNTGVYGYSASGFAGQFQGKVHIAGTVGIGTENPAKKLDVASGDILIRGVDNFTLPGNEATLYLGDINHWIRSQYAYGLIVGTWAAPQAIVVEEWSGNVGIGTSSPAGKLDVNGAIYQRGGVLHADYVFEPDYKLESIEEHSKLMWNDKHLPAIPGSRKDDNGQEIIEFGSLNRGIVEELEKAHIYIEQLNERNKALEIRLAALEEALEKMTIKDGK